MINVNEGICLCVIVAVSLGAMAAEKLEGWVSISFPSFSPLFSLSCHYFPTTPSLHLCSSSLNIHLSEIWGAIQKLPLWDGIHHLSVIKRRAHSTLRWQSQTSEGTIYTWSPGSPKVEGMRFSHGSHRMVATMAISMHSYLSAAVLTT